MPRVFTIDGAGVHAHAVPRLGQDPNPTRFSAREAAAMTGLGLVLGMLAGFFWGRR